MTPMLVSASPSPVTVSIQGAVPPAYLPTKTYGSKFYVYFMIEADELTYDGQNGMIWWKVIAQVDPTILMPLEAPGVQVSVPGYFLYDFADQMMYAYPKNAWAMDTTTGTTEVTEMFFAPLPAGGAATDDFNLPAPYRLFRIPYQVVTTLPIDDPNHYCKIDITTAAYSVLADPETPIDIVGTDGWYGPIVVPEFPLGSVAPIALIAAIAYIWWVTKRKTREAM
jgi:hypothetical protein